MSSTSAQPVLPTLRAVLVGVAVLVAIVVNAGVAAVVRSMDPAGTRTGLILIAYGPLTAFGVLAGTTGWVVVRRYTARPRAVLRVLVPCVVALSFIPGIIQLASGTSPANVFGLWVMHLVVALVTVTTANRAFPLMDK